MAFLVGYSGFEQIQPFEFCRINFCDSVIVHDDVDASNFLAVSGGAQNPLDAKLLVDKTRLCARRVGP